MRRVSKFYFHNVVFFLYVYHDCEFNYRLPGNNSSGGQLALYLLISYSIYFSEKRYDFMRHLLQHYCTHDEQSID